MRVREMLWDVRKRKLNKHTHTHIYKERREKDDKEWRREKMKKIFRL